MGEGLNWAFNIEFIMLMRGLNGHGEQAVGCLSVKMRRKVGPGDGTWKLLAHKLPLEPWS